MQRLQYLRFDRVISNLVYQVCCRTAQRTVKPDEILLLSSGFIISYLSCLEKLFLKRLPPAHMGETTPLLSTRLSPEPHAERER